MTNPAPQKTAQEEICPIHGTKIGALEINQGWLFVCGECHNALTRQLEEARKLIEWHKQDTHDAMEWKRSLESQLSDARGAALLGITYLNQVYRSLSEDGRFPTAVPEISKAISEVEAALNREAK